MSDAQKATAAAAAQTQELGLLDQIVEQGRLARDAASRHRGKDLVSNFVSQVLEGSMTVFERRGSHDQRAYRAD